MLGRATIAFWSTDGSAEWIKPWTWFTAARWDRIGEDLVSEKLADWLEQRIGHRPSDLTLFERR